MRRQKAQLEGYTQINLDFHKQVSTLVCEDVCKERQIENYLLAEVYSY